jgi:hypothetical protein
MGEKSFVTMVQNVCLVCCVPFDTGDLLMDTRIIGGKLRNTFERNTITGWGLCPEHKKLHEDGFVALVEANPPKKYPQANLKPEDADRTGNICHLRRTVADDIFNVKLDPKLPMIFVEPGVIDKLKGMTEGGGTNAENL